MIDWEHGEVLHRGDFGAPIYAGAFAPNDDRVALTGATGEVGLLDLATFRWVIRPVTGTAGDRGFYSVAFSPGGDAFVTAGNGELGLWNAENGHYLGGSTVSRGIEWVLAAFESENELVVTTAGGRSFRWDISLSRMVETACAVAGRNFTRDEWATWFGDHPYHQTCTDAQLR